MSRPQRPCHLAFTLDDTDARDATNGTSRFGEYLRLNRTRFETSDPYEQITDPAEFAAVAFHIGHALISAPPYVQTHRFIVGAVSYWDGAGIPAMSVNLALPTLPEHLRMMTRSRTGWDQLANGHYAEPDDHRKGCAYATLTLRVPFDTLELPAPAYDDGVPDWQTAQESVGLLTDHLNVELAPFLTALAQDHKDGTRR